MDKRFPSAKEVELFHTNSDKDGSPTSIHHTLGNGPNQASPGDHVHDGGTSKELDLIPMPEKLFLQPGASASPPGTSYALVGSTGDFVTEKQVLCLCVLSGLIKAAGTNTNDITVKVVGSGALTFDSSSDVPQYAGRLYHWANSTNQDYVKVTAMWTMVIPAGTTTFGIHAIRSANGTASAAGGLTFEVTPIRLV